MTPAGILETVLYASDLAAAERFYRDVLGMEPFAKAPDRQLFYRCGDQVLLIFNPEATRVPPVPPSLPVPPHGASGPGHACFRASAREIAETTQQYVDERIAAILHDRYDRALALLRGHEGLLRKVAELLLERETLGDREFKELLREEREAALPLA